MAAEAQVEQPLTVPDPTRVRTAVKRLRNAVREADRALASYESELNERGIGLTTTAPRGEGDTP